MEEKKKEDEFGCVSVLGMRSNTRGSEESNHGANGGEPADGWMKRRTAHGKEGYLPLLVPAVETLTTPAPAAVSLKLTFNDASLRLRRVLDLYSSPYS